MPAASLSATPPRYPRLQRFAIDVAITAVFNTAIAVFVTYVLRLHASFLDNLVISMCIGTLMVAFIDGGRLLLWGVGKPPYLPFALLFIAAVPAALLLGNLAGAFFTGIPPRVLGATSTGERGNLLLMFVFLCAAGTWFFWNRGQMESLKARAEAEKARAAAVERQAMQAQLQLLQAQIEPHMLFNTLANLQGLIALDPDRAQQMLDQLIRYLRATLSASRAQATTLEQEFALLDAYLGIMQVRMGPRLTYTLDLPQDLRKHALAPMLLQPLVENAIRHGLEPKLEGGHLTVTAARRDAMLELCVTDTGLGLREGAEGAEAAPIQGSSDLATPQGGVGLANVRERLHALYGERASLALEANQPQGTRATLRLPL